MSFRSAYIELLLRAPVTVSSCLFIRTMTSVVSPLHSPLNDIVNLLYLCLSMKYGSKCQNVYFRLNASRVCLVHAARSDGWHAAVAVSFCFLFVLCWLKAEPSTKIPNFDVSKMNKLKLFISLWANMPSTSINFNNTFRIDCVFVKANWFRTTFLFKHLSF